MASKPAVKPRTAADYRAAHDTDVIVPNKIKAGFTKLLAVGPENWAYDEEFRSLCELQAAQLADYREQFKQYWFITPGQRGKPGKRVWFGDSRVATRLRPDKE